MLAGALILHSTFLQGSRKGVPSPLHPSPCHASGCNMGLCHSHVAPALASLRCSKLSSHDSKHEPMTWRACPSSWRGECSGTRMTREHFALCCSQTEHPPHWDRGSSVSCWGSRPGAQKSLWQVDAFFIIVLNGEEAGKGNLPRKNDRSSPKPTCISHRRVLLRERSPVRGNQRFIFPSHRFPACAQGKARGRRGRECLLGPQGPPGGVRKGKVHGGTSQPFTGPPPTGHRICKVELSIKSQLAPGPCPPGDSSPSPSVSSRLTEMRLSSMVPVFSGSSCLNIPAGEGGPRQHTPARSVSSPPLRPSPRRVCTVNCMCTPRPGGLACRDPKTGTDLFPNSHLLNSVSSRTRHRTKLSKSMMSSSSAKRATMTWWS